MPNVAAAWRAQAESERPGRALRSRGRNHLVFDNGDGTETYIGATGPIHTLAGEELDSGWQPDTTNGFEYSTKRLDSDVVLRLRGSVGANPYQIERGGQSILMRPGILTYRNALGQLQSVGSPTGTAVPSDPVVRWEGAYGAGLHFEVVPHYSGQVRKHLIIDPGALPVSGLSGETWLEWQVGFSASNGLTPFLSDGTLFSPSNNSTTFIPSGTIEWRTDAGVVMGYFTAPRAWDADGNLLPVSMFVRRTGPNLTAWLRVAKTDLDTAVYPVVIDPTYDLSVGASGDDYYYNNYVTEFNATVTAASVGTVFAGRVGKLGMLFRDVAVDSGVTVTESHLSVTATGGGNTSTARSDIFAEDANDPAAATTYADVTGRTKTSISVNADNRPAWTTGTEYQLPDMTDLVQYIIDTYHANGENIHILWEGDSGEFSTKWLGAATYDHATYAPPKLTITYSSSVNYDETGRSAGVAFSTAGTDTQAMLETGRSASVAFATGGTDTYTPGSTNYDETGRSAGVAFSTGGSDTKGMTETGLSAGVSFTTGGTDTQAMSEPGRTASVVFTTDGADAQAMLEQSLSAAVAFATAGTDTQGMTETGRQATVTFTVTGSDVAAFLEQALSAGITFTTAGTDTQAMLEAASAGVTFSTAGTDTYTPLGSTAYDETGRSATVTFATSGSDVQAMIEAALSAGISFAVSSTDVQAMVEAGLSAGVSFATSSDSMLAMLEAAAATVVFSTDGSDTAAFTETGLSVSVVFFTAGSDTYTPVGTPGADFWTVLSNRGADQRLYHSDVKDNSPRQRERFIGYQEQIEIPAASDPTESTYTIAAEAKDWSFYAASGYTSTSAYIGEFTDLEMGFVMKFEGDTIAADKTVQSALLTLTRSSAVGTPTSAKAYACKTDAADPTNRATLDAVVATKSTAYTVFSLDTSTWGVNTGRTVDIAAALQEAVSAGHTAGGVLYVTVIGDHTSAVSNYAVPHDGGTATPGYRPQLVVTWV